MHLIQFPRTAILIRGISTCDSRTLHSSIWCCIRWNVPGSIVAYCFAWGMFWSFVCYFVGILSSQLYYALYGHLLAFGCFPWGTCFSQVSLVWNVFLLLSFEHH